jgi:cytoskeleton protein RodZ
MKTVGELIFNARKSHNLTIKKLAYITKIDPEHIKKLEKDQYHLLPPPTFIKGFIRNIATVLDQNPNDLVAIFRRDYRSPQSSLLPSKKIHQSRLKAPHLTSKWSLVALGVIVFITYLGFQLRAYIIPPPLDITQPSPQSVAISPLVIEGVTSTESIIQINQETPIVPDSSGYFITTISLPPMETDIKITSTNRFGRTNQKVIPVTIISQ